MKELLCVKFFIYVMLFYLFKIQQIVSCMRTKYRQGVPQDVTATEARAGFAKQSN